MRFRYRTGVAIGCVAAVVAASPAAAPAKVRGAVRTFKAEETGVSAVRVLPSGAFDETGAAFISGALIGDGRLHIDSMLTPGQNGVYSGHGRFTITAEDGDSFHGTMEGTGKPAGQVSPIRFVSTITGGTGRFRGARGRLVSTGTTTVISAEDGLIKTVDSAICQGRIRLASHGG